jgi:hypothetical protein
VVAGASGRPDGVVGVPDHVARNNGLLLAFNMVPALPLDGGRLPQPSAATKGPRRGLRESRAEATEAYRLIWVAARAK